MDGEGRRGRKEGERGKAGNRRENQQGMVMERLELLGSWVWEMLGENFEPRFWFRPH